MPRPTTSTDPAVQYLLDRQAIFDCLVRYCRGVDRFDRELFLSAYHEDAIDDHRQYIGGPIGFVDWVFALHGKGQISTRHQLGNHSCEIDGDVAEAETYYLYTGRNRDETVMIASGRYLDRLERRDGEWRIAARHCTVEWISKMTEGVPPAINRLNGDPTRDRNDPTYQRPLVVKAA